MTPKVSRLVHAPEFLEHGLSDYFPELLRFESIQDLEASPIHGEIHDEAERILNSVVYEDFAQPGQADNDVIRAAAWNIERGTVFDGILAALREHPGLADRDIYHLTELDHGMARSGNRFVARELAESLGLNYAFAPVYIALQKGSGVEAEVEGENTLSLHGLATLSKWPMANIHAVPLPNGK
ncbi:MAG TPA: hypothetical protein VK918_09655, partial [Pyrinomonadaceae bacterium]|nr:hypothetical protein [Pyrinomonadaceae bacterium]